MTSDEGMLPSILWYAAQRTSGYGRKALAKRKLRRKLGDYGQLWAAQYPPKPRRMRRCFPTPTAGRAILPRLSPASPCPYTY